MKKILGTYLIIIGVLGVALISSFAISLSVLGKQSEGLFSRIIAFLFTGSFYSLFVLIGLGLVAGFIKFVLNLIHPK